MACTPDNKYAKNLCKRSVILQLFIENVVTFFFEHSVYMVYIIRYLSVTKYVSHLTLLWQQT